MQSRRIAVLVCLAATACQRSPDIGGVDYVSRLAAARTAKDARFRAASDPVPDARKADLLPLDYFPIDPSYKVPAVLKPSGDQAIVPMQTSTGQTRKQRRAGTLEFTLMGTPLTLTAFVEADQADLTRLFVPFSDLTSGTDTYPAGRYLDLERASSGSYDLDFNTAYHPYCYYNFGYECPLPPVENRLHAYIRAGERMKEPTPAPADTGR